MSFDTKEFLKNGAVMSLSQEDVLVAWGKAHATPWDGTNPDLPAFYYPNFFLTYSKPWYQYAHWKECTIDELKDFLQIDSSSFAHSVQWTLEKPEQFKKTFEELSKDLQMNRLKKAVPYLFANSFEKMTKERLCSSLRKAITALTNKTGFLYGRWEEQKGILGVTPELLFSHRQKEPQKVKTMAVAGTCHPSEDQEAFFHNDKQRYEHQLVVEGICQSLQTLGMIEVQPLQLLRLPKLVHLMTPMELTLFQPFRFDTIVQRLHPTPALGAFPADEGWKWLERFDKHTPRLHYGAPVGLHYPTKGISQCCVAIRNVQWDPSGMRIGAGCGVVKQSSFDKEWKEIHIKIRAIRDQLHL